MKPSSCICVTADRITYIYITKCIAASIVNMNSIWAQLSLFLWRHNTTNKEIVEKRKKVLVKVEKKISPNFEYLISSPNFEYLIIW